MHVGLPWIEKASYCDVSELQERRAELFLSLATMGDESYSSSTTFMRILEQLNPWDYKVLDYMVNNGGVSKSYLRQVDFNILMRSVSPSSEGDLNRTVLSVEKLVRRGCLDRLKIEASAQNFEISMHSNMGSFVSLTLTGLNFHIAVTGHAPNWLNNEDSKLW